MFTLRLNLMFGSYCENMFIIRHSENEVGA